MNTLNNLYQQLAECRCEKTKQKYCHLCWFTKFMLSDGYVVYVL